MPQTIQSPVNALSSADWFKAKLQFEIGPVELDHLLEEKDSVIALDVRDADSFAKEHIPGAINIPLADLPKRFSQIPRDKTIVTYCWTVTCHLATKAALELAEHGYKVLELVGGIGEWKKGGLPVEGAESSQTKKA